MSKIKFPKTIIIGGREWRIIIDDKVSGAEFTHKKAEIRISSDYGKEEKAIWFLHEALEAILVERLARTSDPYPDDNYLFVFDHRQFVGIVKDLYLAIKDIIKKG